MYLSVAGANLYCYTGGVPLAPGRPTAVLLHGVLNDHSVWAPYVRKLAAQGWNALAPDLPGHGRSGGTAPSTVEEAAAQVLQLLDAAGLERAALAGHSFGSLVALEVAGTAPARVSHLAMVGTAFPMAVSPTVLDTALHKPHLAIDMVVQFSHARRAELPGQAANADPMLHRQARAMMNRLLAASPEVNLLHRGLAACDNYQGGEARMADVQCPTLFILGQHDLMTRPTKAQTLIAAARDGRSATLDAGHSLMTEDPRGVGQALSEFLRA